MAYCGPRGIALSAFLAWSQGDQDAALAWQAREGSRCGGCGTHEADWDDDNRAWVPEVHICPGCEQLEQARAAQPPGFRGVTVRLTRPT
jgi:hypothetical protein